ncbi:MAG: alpha-E domain-containing protein [Hyphomicrobiales bacterium]
MLSRTADSLFWFSRYVERAENTARLLEAAGRLSSLPTHYAGSTNEWESALLATGALGQFYQGNEEATADSVVAFLAFDEENPSSIKSCVQGARANARAVRTALTIETWEAINDTWLRLRRFDGRPLSRPLLNEMIGFIKEASLQVDGSAYRTMLRTDNYFFMRLGTYMERADATARILDVKYHVLLPAGERVGGGLDYVQWRSILRSVSALTSYHWVYRENIKPWLVADLLILRKEMPRSLSNCVANLVSFLDQIAADYGQQGPAQRMARQMYAHLENARIEDIFQSGLHEFLSEFIADINRLGEAISRQYLL